MSSLKAINVFLNEVAEEFGEIIVEGANRIGMSPISSIEKCLMCLFVLLNALMLSGGFL